MFKDKEAQRVANREAAKRYRDAKKGMTPSPVIPDQKEAVIPKNVIPLRDTRVIPDKGSEAYKEARYRAYKEGHLHEFNAGRG